MTYEKVKSSEPCSLLFCETFCLKTRLNDVDDVVANRIQDQVANRVQIKFPHDVRTMGFSGFHTKAEYNSHFL